ncbi:MAG: hypothetical protein IT514_16515 [Burkholderiales bacterium]|nr:hypothetical protein [Burkholderiales bacterium]
MSVRVDRLLDEGGALSETVVVVLGGAEPQLLCVCDTLELARQQAAFFEALARSGSGNGSSPWPSLLLPEGGTVAMPGDAWEALAATIEEVCAWTTPPGERRA